jgi:F-type H+-transporting ATPase subunit c
MKFVKIAALALGLLFLAQAPASAQGTSTDDQARISAAGQPKHAFSDLRGLGVGLTIMGAAIGIGWLTRSAVESMARQPEVAANIQTAMIISAALIEGVTFFALIIIGFILKTY